VHVVSRTMGSCY